MLKSTSRSCRRSRLGPYHTYQGFTTACNSRQPDPLSWALWTPACPCVYTQTRTHGQTLRKNLCRLTGMTLCSPSSSAFSVSSESSQSIVPLWRWKEQVAVLDTSCLYANRKGLPCCFLRASCVPWREQPARVGLHDPVTPREALTPENNWRTQLENLVVFSRHLGAAQDSLSGWETIGDVTQESQSWMKGQWKLWFI